MSVTSLTSPASERKAVAESLALSRAECRKLKRILFLNNANDPVGLAVAAFDLFLARLQAGQVIHFSDWLRLAELFSGGRSKR